MTMTDDERKALEIVPVFAAAKRAAMATKKRMDGYCSYPDCKCIVSTSTTQPEPDCPLGLA